MFHIACIFLDFVQQIRLVDNLKDHLAMGTSNALKKSYDA